MSVSSWMDAAGAPAGRILESDTEADVCIVGAGIAGLTTAYHLLKEGLTVAVLESKHIGAGETERTTAHVSTALDDRYGHIERVRGQDAARLAAQAHAAAIDRIEMIAREERIPCDFRRLDGRLFPASEQSVDKLNEELAAAHRAGLSDVSLEETSALPAYDTQAFLRFPNQAQFHPLHYLYGLAHAIERNGGRIFTGAEAQVPEGSDPVTVTTRHGRAVRASSVVLATNMPIGADARIYAHVYPYRTYVIAGRVPKGSVPAGLFWDDADPYHYVRLQPPEDGSTEELLIVGGEDHKVGQEEEPRARWERLEQWARERFPSMQEVRYRWSGQVQETADGLALIGRKPGEERNIYVVTGDSGMGMTHGTIAGMLLTDLILQRENPWADLFDPSRTPIKGGGMLLKENANVGKELAKGWLRPGEVSSADDVQPGQGAIMRDGITKIALYRDDDGSLHRLSAVCTHKGCIVNWNDAEKSWDCPCHGSRFTKDGGVLCGPAHEGLETAELTPPRTPSAARQDQTSSSAETPA